MSPATDERSVVREHLERYRSITQQTLDLVPGDKLSWRPHDGAWSFAQQFLHIAQTEEYYAHGVFESAWNEERFHLPAEPLTRPLLRRRLEETRAFLLARLDGLALARLAEIVRVPNIPIQWPLRSWLWYLVEHEIHHKSQLALYLRSIGILPPFFAYALPPGVRPDLR